MTNMPVILSKAKLAAPRSAGNGSIQSDIVADVPIKNTIIFNPNPILVILAIPSPGIIFLCNPIATI